MNLLHFLLYTPDGAVILFLLTLFAIICAIDLYRWWTWRKEFFKDEDPQNYRRPLQ